MNRIATPMICLLALTCFACADPAKDKPQAVVEEAATEAPAAEAEAQRYLLAEGSSVGFIGSKVTGSHNGGFHGFDAELLVTDGDPARSSVNITIDTTTLWADDERLTGHLKSPDFFDVESYPTATFTSTEIVAEGDGYTITGNLTLHGITKSISFPAAIGFEGEQLRASAEFAIKRFEFDIVYPGKTDDLIRDDVVIQFDVIGTPGSAS